MVDSIKKIGYKKNSEVLNFYTKSEIAIGNSVWDEPLGRIAIEASSRKCLPIISNKGGLAESKNIAVVLKENNANELFKILKKITSNITLRRKKQFLFYKNNNFDIKIISRKLDDIRMEIIDQNKIKQVYFPAAIGFHPDHLITYRGCCNLKNTQLIVYQDFPYCNQTFYKYTRMFFIRYNQII